MTLLQAVRDLEILDELATIYAAEPWTETSSAIVIIEPDSGDLPKEAQRTGMKYFLEVSTARELLQGWTGGLPREPTIREKCSRLIQYARTDA